MPERQVITSLVGTIAPLLTVDVRDIRAMDESSIFLPREWKKSTPFVVDDIHLDPINPTSLNAEILFEVPKAMHSIIDFCLHAVLPSHTLSVPGNAYYVDHLGYAMYDEIVMNFGSNRVYDRRPYDFYFKYRQAYDMEHRDAINYLIGGDQSIAQRTAALQNGRELYTDLMFPSNWYFTQALPIVVLSQKLRITVRTKALQNITNQTNPLVPVTITPNGTYNFDLRLKVLHLTGLEGDRLVAMSRDPHGLSYMIHQNVRQNSDDFTNQVSGATVSIKLSNITKPLRLLYWALVPTRLVNDTGYNDIFFFQPQPTLGPIPPGMSAYSPITSWGIEAAGQIIQRTVLRDYNRVYEHYKFHPSPFGDEIFEQLYSMFPHSVNAAAGYLDYTNLNNPTLNITLGIGGTGVDPLNPQVGQSLRLVVNAEDYNFWFFKSGNMSRAFN